MHIVLNSENTSMQKVKLVLEMSRKFLTHLDKQNTNADNLPLELFDDFVSESIEIKKMID